MRRPLSPAPNCSDDLGSEDEGRPNEPVVVFGRGGGPSPQPPRGGKGLSPSSAFETLTIGQQCRSFSSIILSNLLKHERRDHTKNKTNINHLRRTNKAHNALVGYNVCGTLSMSSARSSRATAREGARRWATHLVIVGLAEFTSPQGWRRRRAQQWTSCPTRIEESAVFRRA